MSDEQEEPGDGAGRQRPRADEGEEHRASRQRGDPHALDVAGDPRGVVQSADYRQADPSEVVIEGDTAMMGPGGAPQEGKSVAERRRESQEWREQGPPGSAKRSTERD